MKRNKLFLSAIILGVAILAIFVCALFNCVALKPAITAGEFPFSVTYELDGETVTIRDVYKVRYDGNVRTSRVYVGEIGDTGVDNTIYTLKQEPKSSRRIELHTRFYTDYLMGDADYDYLDAFEPWLYYYDADEQEYSDEETLLAQGVKLVGFEYPTPIENKLLFSHFTYCNGEVVFPALLVALLALLAIMIFVRKGHRVEYKKMDTVSTVFNFVVFFTLVPFVSLLAMLIDIEGGGPEFYYQVLYFIPAISVLSIAASVALRRRGYALQALITEFIGPAIFAIYLVVCGVMGLL